MSSTRIQTWTEKSKRTQFIQNSTSVRETFKFADPEQVLQAVKVYCCDFYGSRLWDLYGDQAEQLYRCWNTCLKLSWDVPRSTHTFFVDGLLGCGFPTSRQQILSRYVKFYRSLLNSPSHEVAVVARLVGKDAKSVTGKNLLNIRLETKLNVFSAPLQKIKDAISLATPPAPEQWKLYLLDKYISRRKDLRTRCEETNYLDNLIDSLCST